MGGQAAQALALNSAPSIMMTRMTTPRVARPGRTAGFRFIHCMTIRHVNSTGLLNGPRKVFARQNPTLLSTSSTWCLRHRYANHLRNLPGSWRVQPRADAALRQFAADRASCVLATNIIDLRLKYAKVAALGSAPETGRRSRQAGRRARKPRRATTATRRQPSTLQPSTRRVSTHPLSTRRLSTRRRRARGRRELHAGEGLRRGQ